MERVRQTLQRLGWPVETLADEQIALYLHRLWFSARPEQADPEPAISPAAAQGIVATLASEGNLDALCWPGQHGAAPAEDELTEELAVFQRHRADPAQADRAPSSERRRSPRKPVKELVRWRDASLDEGDFTGWVVCRSDEGIAFIVEATEAPQPGSEITPRIHSRSGEVLELGSATVVRNEALSEDLILVCAHLEESHPVEYEPGS